MRLLILFIVLFSIVGQAAATDYYVSTTGSNTNGGTSPANAWLHPALAVNNATAGDTIYLIDGTWEGEHIDFDGKQGNVTHPITLTKYNGTVILNNSYIEASGTTPLDSYITISDITVCNYYGGDGIAFRYSDNIIISNIEVYNVSGEAINLYECTNSIIRDSLVYNTGWNSIGISSQVHDVHDILIENNTIHDSSFNGTNHNTLDFFNYLSDASMHDVTVMNNVIYNATQALLYFHTGSTGTNFSNFNISNNVFHDSGSGGYVFTNFLVDSIFINNTIYNSGIKTDLGVFDNVTYRNNTIYSPNSGDQQFTLIMSDLANVTHTSINDNCSTFRAMNGVFVVQDAYLNTYSVRGSGLGLEVKYSEGNIFTETGSDSPIYYPKHSNWTTTDDNIRTIIKYNTTLKPITGYLTAIVNTYADDVYNFTIDSSVAANPTWINITTANASTNYSLYRDGSFFDVAESGIDSIVSFYYDVVGGDEWSSHDFQIEYNSTGTSTFVPDTSKNYFGTPRTTYQNGTSAFLGTQPTPSHIICNISVRGYT
jgi:hypothetical protein